MGVTASSLGGSHQLVTAGSGAVRSEVRKLMASLASGHKADPLCPGLGPPAQRPPTQGSPPLKSWLSKAEVRSPEPVYFQTCLVYFCILVVSL